MHNAPDPRLPILVGVGQTVQRELGDPHTLQSPIALAATAAAAALADVGAARDFRQAIDTLAVVRLFEHSVGDRGLWANPFGSSENVPGCVARRLGLAPTQAIYAEVGGQSPQRLVNTLAARIHAGEIRAALLTGAEAIATIRHATRAGITLDWREEATGAFEDRWPGKPFVTPYEQRHGIAWPIHVYALFEQVRRHQRGRTLAACREEIAALFAPFSQIAARHPYAQFPRAREAAFLATPSADNYPLCEPYTRWMVAQDAVNQGASVILTSVGVAREYGIPPTQWIHLHGHADVDEVNVLRRPRLETSLAQTLAVRTALESSGTAIEAVGLVDFYSCFPIAVTSIAEPLGLPLEGSRPLTLTGGLPFFGGAGNNYSMHAIATLVTLLRQRPAEVGLIAANGGYLSKHSAGIYSASAPTEWAPVSCAAQQAEVEKAGDVQVDELGEGEAVIESVAAPWVKGRTTEGFVVARFTRSGARCLARTTPGDQAGIDVLFEEQVIGRRIKVVLRDGLHHYTLACA